MSANITVAELADELVDSAHNKQTDETLMERYAAGDFEAFSELYHRHKGGLYRYFMRQIPQHSLAEDLYQEIWSKVIVQAEHYQASAKFTTWLYTLAHNKLVDHIRHLSVVGKVIDDGLEAENDTFDSDALSADKVLEKYMQVEALKHCLTKLPQAQKDSFLLKEEAGLSLKDIASVLNINYEACKSRLRYAYANLRECITRKVGSELL